MNFANKLVASAEKAAAVAKNFKGFDEMAEKDEYIHSEGLNVGGSKSDGKQPTPHVTSTPQTRISRRPLETASPPKASQLGASDSLHSTEPTWSLLDRPHPARQSSRNGSTISSASPASSISPPRQRQSIRNRPPAAEVTTATRPPLSHPRAETTSKMPYMSIVADTLEGSSVSGSGGRHQHDIRHASYSGYDSDNEESSVNAKAGSYSHRRYHSTVSSNTSSSNSSISSSTSSYDSDGDSEDEEDPILLQIRKAKGSRSQSKSNQHQKKKKKKHNRHQTSSTRNKYRYNQHRHNHEKNHGKKKNPNRFMEELDERAEALSQEQQQQVFEMETTTESVRPEDVKSTINSFKNWMAKSLQNHPQASKITAKASSLLKLGPLSARRDKASVSVDAQEEQDFKVLASSNVLGDEDLAALAQLNSDQQSSILRKLYQTIRHNPREAFIVFTLVLGIFVFFFSRKKSNADDVQ